MRRLLAACTLSVALYMLLFGAVARFPLSRGLLESELTQKSARLQSLGSPKLVILAGSNGPYSHSCAVFEAALALPCENAGIAVGFGLDEIFAHYAPALHAGDIVYMPMELRQYKARARDYDSAPDGEMLWRDEKPVLRDLPPARVAGAIFCCTALDTLEALIEQPLSHARMLAPASILAHEYAADGDRIDNAPTATPPPPAAPAPSATAIAQGYGARLIADFVKSERERGVIVIGGLPTEAGGTLDEDRLAAVQAIFGAADFVMLDDRSHYPPADFSNSPDHLNRPCQLLHSLAVAPLLAARLHVALQIMPENIQREAATCPSALHITAQN